MDYDDDEDDDDFNPPSRKSEPATEDKKTADSSSKSKRNSPDGQQEDSEPTKKQRLDQQPNDGKIPVAAACSTCSQVDLPSEDAAAAYATEGTGGNSDDNGTEKESAARENCSNCLSETVDTRQPRGEDCQSTPISTSPQDMAGNVAGSEPYPVR